MINCQPNRRQNQKINQNPLPLIHHINSGSQLVLVIGQLEAVEELFGEGGSGRETAGWSVDEVVDAGSREE